MSSTRRGESVLYAGDTTGGAGGARGRGAPAPLDPKLDTMVNYSLYCGHPEPGGRLGLGRRERYPGFLVRLQRGNNPPSSCKSQLFKVPEPGFDPRGVDIDSNGVVWTALAASSHLASFDVRKCKDLNGPAKTDGSQCREGWTLYQTTGPKFKGTDVPTDFHYYNWVDQHNISGLGHEYTVRHRIELGLAARAEPADPAVDDVARPLPARVLFARHGRPHRRSERRMEGPRSSTRITARTSSGTSRAAKAPRARSSISRFGRTRWRDKDLEIGKLVNLVIWQLNWYSIHQFTNSPIPLMRCGDRVWGVPGPVPLTDTSPIATIVETITNR